MNTLAKWNAYGGRYEVRAGTNLVMASFDGERWINSRGGEVLPQRDETIFFRGGKLDGQRRAF